MNLIRRVMAVLTPWPDRGARKAAIRDAREQREQSRAGAAHAAALTAQIERLAADNHFASTIARQLIQRHRE